MTTTTRDQVQESDQWDLKPLYPSFAEWEKEFAAVYPAHAEAKWPEIARYKGKLSEGAHAIKGVVEAILAADRALNKLYTFAHLKHDEDITNDSHKSAKTRITNAFHDFSQQISWFEPEMLSLNESFLQQVLQAPELKEYRIHLEKIVRAKKHMLSEKEEALLALAQNAFQTPGKAFSSLNDADFSFGEVTDSDGNKHPLTHATYGIYLHGKDRTLRQNAFTNLHKKYADYRNTLTELLNGAVQAHVFNAKARHYSSCLEAALFPHNIDVSVYRSLIAAVHKRIGSLHRYLKLRAKLLQLDVLRPFDLSVPLIPSVDIRLSYDEAADLVADSVAPLGNAYQNALRKGLTGQRWVDRFENEGKRSGAYSSGCYDSHPYVLMNYKNILRDVFTLAHECGHSMHSYLSNQEQPYHYSGYPIFVAEVASTFNEELLMQAMLKRAEKDEERAYLINQKIDDIRATLFRQTLFAEFELWIHEQAEKGIPLTPASVSEEYRRLTAFYFGDAVQLDELVDIEWARIPHFYYNFYVYQYATGISAALALANRVSNGGELEREQYLSFLKGGSSRYPIDLLQQAGVDMRTAEPIERAIDRFDALVSELEKLAVTQSVC